MQSVIITTNKFAACVGVCRCLPPSDYPCRQGDRRDYRRDLGGA
jgi:hypothetical protein